MEINLDALSVCLALKRDLYEQVVLSTVGFVVETLIMTRDGRREIDVTETNGLRIICRGTIKIIGGMRE